MAQTLFPIIPMTPSRFGSMSKTVNAPARDEAMCDTVVMNAEDLQNAVAASDVEDQRKGLHRLIRELYEGEDLDVQQADDAHQAIDKLDDNAVGTLHEEVMGEDFDIRIVRESIAKASKVPFHAMDYNAKERTETGAISPDDLTAEELLEQVKGASA